MTPTDLDMFKVINTNTHATCIHPEATFSSISLYDETLSSYAPFFGNVHRMTPNDLDMFKVKCYQHACHITPEAQRPFRSTTSRF